MKCNNCGAALEPRSTFCGYCGTAITAARPAAPLAVAVAPQAFAAQPAMAGVPALNMPFGQAASTGAAPVYADLPAYYVDAFAQIDARGRNASKWNWAAFCFGPAWYLYRGMWLKALITMGLACVPAFTLLVWIYSGKWGNADLWQLRRQGKQFW
jgi:hypothetical protein